MPQRAPEAEERSWAHRSRGWRLLLVTLVLLTSTAVAVFGTPRTCSEQLAPATGEVVNVCGRVQALDPAVLGILALVLLLLAPDLSEASLGGVIVVKRQIEEAKADAARAQAEAAGVRVEIAMLQSAIAQAELTATQHLSAQQHTTVTAGTDTVAVLEWVSNMVGLGAPSAEDSTTSAAESSEGLDELADVAEGRVAVANRAFESIAEMLPSGWSEGAVVGVVEGDPHVVYVAGQPAAATDPRDQLEQAGVLHSAALTGRPVGVESAGGTPAMAAAPVLNAAGRRIGTLGFIAGDQLAGFDEELGSQVEQAADFFARIVIDLLRLHDDRPSPGGSVPDQAD